MGLAAETSSYRQTAIVANVRTELPHERTAWQRFLRTGTLAFLPLADGCSSIVWSADDAAAAPLLAMSPGDFEQELLRQSDGVLGALKLRTERLSFPLHKLTAHRFTAHRCALIGDAAHVVHPLAGQGVNLGLLDAAALCELICAAFRMREDPGAQTVLRRYERWRKSEIEPIALAIDGFNRYLAHGVGPLSRLAQRGLALVNRSDEVKRFFITRALGLAGELPRIARQRPRRRPRPRQLSGICVDLRGADEVVLAQPLDGVRRVLHPAIVVADLEIRMMILDVGDMRERIDEAHGPIKILELELPPQIRPFLRQHPVRMQVLHEPLRLLARVRRNPAFTGLAMLLATARS